MCGGKVGAPSESTYRIYEIYEAAVALLKAPRGGEGAFPGYIHLRGLRASVASQQTLLCARGQVRDLRDLQSLGRCRRNATNTVILGKGECAYEMYGIYGIYGIYEIYKIYFYGIEWVCEIYVVYRAAVVIQ